MSSTSVSFLQSLGSGRQSASYYDRNDVETTNSCELNTHGGGGGGMGGTVAASTPFIESCPAGVRCPFRSKMQVEVSRNNSLTAARAVLEESNAYLQSKCDALSVENERLRHELNASERSAIDAHKVAATLSTVSSLNKQGASEQQNSTAAANPPPSWQQQFQELREDIQRANSEKGMLLSQVHTLQDALEKMTAMNEDLLRHIKKATATTTGGHGGGGGFTASASALRAFSSSVTPSVGGDNGTVAVSSRASSQGGLAVAHNINNNNTTAADERLVSNAVATTGGAWRAAMSGGGGVGKAEDLTHRSFSTTTAGGGVGGGTAPSSSTLLADDTYLYGGHKGYPADLPATTIEPKGVGGGRQQQPLAHGSFGASTTAPAAVADGTTTALPGATAAFRYGPRDAAKGMEEEAKVARRRLDEDKTVAAAAPRCLTSDMSGISTAELLEQQRRDKEMYEEALAKQQQLKGPNSTAAANHYLDPTLNTAANASRVLPISSIIENISARKGGPAEELVNRYMNAAPPAISSPSPSSFSAAQQQYKTPERPPTGKAKSPAASQPSPAAMRPASTPAMPLSIATNTAVVSDADGRALPQRPRQGSQQPSSRSGTPTQNHNTNTYTTYRSGSANPSRPMIDALKVLDGVLPPQQPHHYRMKDGTDPSSPARLRSGSGMGVNSVASEDGLNSSVRSSGLNSVTGRPNSTRRPQRTPTHNAREHATEVPEEGKDNIYSRLKQQGPSADQGAPFRNTNLAGRATTPIRDGGAKNPLTGSTPVRLGNQANRQFASTTGGGNNDASSVGVEFDAVAVAAAEKERLPRLQQEQADEQRARAEREREAELAAIEANRKERELRRQQQLKELEELEQQQAQLKKKESFRPKPEDDDDEATRRAPRRADSSLLGSATRLVKRERVVFLRIPGREMYLEMLLKDGSGITRRTVNGHPQKGLAAVWSCFFKK